MKFYTSTLFLIIFLFASKHAFASTISGTGCNLGNRIYTAKIGTSNFWGINFDVYNLNGTNYPINWNNSSQCNQVNANAITEFKKSACWVNSYVNPTNNNSGVSYGTLVSYTVTTCTTANLPLDNYSLLLLLTIGGFGAFTLYRREIIIG